MSRYRTVASFLLLAVAWGTAFVAIRAGLEYFPPVLFAALRYDLAAAFMLAYAAYATDRPVPRTREEWLAVGIGGTLLIAAYHAFLFVGQQSVTSAMAAVIVSLSPVLTTAFARVLLPSERLAPAGLLGMALGLAGVAILSRPDPGNVLSADVIATGLILAGAAAFALGSVLLRRAEAELPIETLEGWSMALGALLMHALSVWMPGEAFAAVEWSSEAVLALAYLAVVSSAVGFLLYFDLLERLGPIEINLVSYVVPVVTAIAGWLLLAEALDPATIGGFLIIFVGFCLIKRRQLVAELPAMRAAITDRL
ncbi:putative integral membrane protein (TBD) [Halalkalicoccus jeotgali B3]|uniref:Integral membrane protein (TBD) n=3 Tax=Halalkalicoccus jeotgali TaxID=413810 RepID=D8JAK0_HALJB|nr:putative integral membrane protein (TBD) [Halalkalicoccus jeotgali B3]